jgi:hypothetical protein
MWPTAAALWNLRWQVAGFRSVCPKCTEGDFQKRFVLGSGINGASLEMACIRSTWSDNQEHFAQFLLFHTFSIYESWIADMLDLFNVKSRTTEKGLQFPTNLAEKKGISFAISRLTSTKSQILEASYYKCQSSAAPFDPAVLENLMIVYRAFKECRNCFAHEGGNCSVAAKEACDKYRKITSPAEINAKELPLMLSQVSGTPVKLSLRGCVGFTDIVLKLVSTIDLELSRSDKAESILIADLKSRISGYWSKRLLKSDPKARRHKINHQLYGIGYPRFDVTDDLCEFLRTHKIITY